MARIHLFNIKNEHFPSKSFRFRATLNENRDESLIDFIKRNFSDILEKDSLLQIQLETL